jgi:cephalosporin hydroxylase
MITVDEKGGWLEVHSDAGVQRHLLSTPEAFAIMSRLWVRATWDTKYVYAFSWMGRPVIQLPDDLLRIQEVIWRIKPDVIIETGVAHGGSLIFYASILNVLGSGRVIGVDIDIRPHNRKAIIEHPLYRFITLIEGSSVAPATVAQVNSLIAPGQRVLVVLDSNHTKAHVLEELRSYAPLVSVGSYIVACDGMLELVAGAPRTKDDWSWNNPLQAAHAFVAERDDFVIEEPEFPFNESVVRTRVSYWPDAFIKRLK